MNAACAGRFDRVPNLRIALLCVVTADEHPSEPATRHGCQRVRPRGESVAANNTSSVLALVASPVTDTLVVL